jgi:hypothetical protein
LALVFSIFKFLKIYLFKLLYKLIIYYSIRYNYGKGIYFADIFGKSACYCRGGTSNNEILIMVVKVAVGNMNVL